MRMIRNIVVVFISLLFIQVGTWAQIVDSDLLRRANKGDPEAMYQAGMAYEALGDTGYLEEAYRWFAKSADKDYAPAQAMLAYHLKNGIGTIQDSGTAMTWAKKASSHDDGLATWILAQLSSDNGALSSDAMQYVKKAFDLDYPIAKLLYAKMYSEGSFDYQFPKDVKMARSLLREVADAGDVSANALLGVLLRKESDNSEEAFNRLKMAADKGNAEAMAQIASMYYLGEGVPKADESEAFKYYKLSADAGDPSGIEGLADCYRLGIGSGGVFNEWASGLYNRIGKESPRLSYLKGYYLNKGEGIPKDINRALSLFQSAASAGNVFAQALLGVSCFEGSDPFTSKDYEKAFPYLNAALNNKDFSLLPNSLSASVCQYAAVCKRYGFGTEMVISEADALRDRSNDLKSLATGESVPFGLVGMITREESLSSCPLSWESGEFSNILQKVTFDYPKPAMAVKVESAPAPPKVQKQQNGRVAAFFELGPFGFAPTSHISSRDGESYWIKGSVFDASFSLGWLADSGFFIGGGAGISSFSDKRMTAIEGFLDARYIIQMGGALSPFLGARGGVAYGAPDVGIGLHYGGSVGLKIDLGKGIAIDLGVKAAMNTLNDDNKTKGGLVVPFVGICF